MFQIAFLAHDRAGLRLKNLIEQIEHSFRAERLGERRGVAQIRQQQNHVGATRFHGAGIGEDGFEHARRKI